MILSQISKKNSPVFLSLYAYALLSPKLKVLVCNTIAVVPLCLSLLRHIRPTLSNHRHDLLAQLPLLHLVAPTS